MNCSASRRSGIPRTELEGAVRVQDRHDGIDARHAAEGADHDRDERRVVACPLGQVVPQHADGAVAFEGDAHERPSGLESAQRRNEGEEVVRRCGADDGRHAE